MAHHTYRPGTWRKTYFVDKRRKRTPIGLAIRAFLRLEQHRLVTGVSRWEAKTEIIRAAVRAYLAHPLYTLRTTA